MAAPPAASCTVWGVSAEDLRGILEKHYPDRVCKVESGGVSVAAAAAPENSEQEKDAVITFLREEASNLEMKMAVSNASIHAFHAQQKQLFDEFCLLRQRYDDQKQNLIETLWSKCAPVHEELQCIPSLDEVLIANESEERVGPYAIGALLGEGQFATVKACWREEDTAAGSEEQEPAEQWAIKIIKKERLTTFASLRRVSNEIDILRVLKSPFVVKLFTAIQSPSKLYIITEKGGSDLFEFFDEHPEGVPEPWAREITAHLLRGILYCHRQGICHRGERVIACVLISKIFPCLTPLAPPRRQTSSLKTCFSGSTMKTSAASTSSCATLGCLSRRNPVHC